MLFSLILGVIFVLWYTREKTLSVHTICTTRRETFYWLAILFTFALGTAAGDLAAEQLNLGYAVSALLFGAVIAAIAVAHLRFKLNPILAFWIAYVLTRPLGASLGDYFSQARGDGGLGWGTMPTSALFLIAIFSTVLSLILTKKRRTIPNDSFAEKEEAAPAGFPLVGPKESNIGTDRV